MKAHLYPASSIQPPTLSDSLTKEILNLVHAADMQPGSRLPSVRALAERFSVAPPTVREALRRLQASGIVKIKHGSGVYVRHGRERIVLSYPGQAKLDAQTILNLLDTRRIIEPHCAALAAQNADRATVADLEKYLKDAEQCLSGDDEMLYTANMGFHRAIASFSGNFVLAQVIDSLIEIHSFEQLVLIPLYNDRLHDHKEHAAILAAITSNDAEQAYELMYRHIHGVRAAVEAHLDGGGSLDD